MKNLAHQDRAVERFSGARFFGLLWDCGTGKTRAAVKIAEADAGDVDMRVLVICPHVLMRQWADAVEAHKEKDSSVFVLEAAKAKTKKGAEALREFIK